MKSLNAAAMVLALLFVLVKVAGHFAGLLIANDAPAVSPEQWKQWLWLAGILPVFAVHLGVGLWLQDRAMADDRKQSAMWGLFGLCFGPLAGVIYAGMMALEKPSRR